MLTKISARFIVILLLFKYKQRRLSQWANRAVALGPERKRGPRAYGPDNKKNSRTPTQYQKTSIKLRFVFTKKD